MKNKKTLLSLIAILAISLTQSDIFAKQGLSQFRYEGSGVLPVYYRKGTKWVVLSRERWGSASGTYDSFSGSREIWEKHPIETASHECAEELITHLTLGKNKKDMKNYLDLSAGHTEHIIAHKRGKYVFYITRFDGYIDDIKKNFYKALKNKKLSSAYKEKDRIAFVKWKDFAHAIESSRPRREIPKVSALVLNPTTNKLERETIKLRPVLKILRPFLQDAPYEEGYNKKIRFY